MDQNQRSKEVVEKEMYEHYRKIFIELFRECIFNLPPELDTLCIAFGADKRELTIKAAEEVLNTYKQKDDI